MEIHPELEHLQAFRNCTERVRQAWPGFLRRRAERLQAHPFQAAAPEQVTESILHDLFTEVLDWEMSGVNPQVGRADLVLSDRGIRWMIVEAKRPGALLGHARAVERAMDQAARYAAEQHVRRVAVCDGTLLHAADVKDGGRQPRVTLHLPHDDSPRDLWWLSVQGIYRDADTLDRALPPPAPGGAPAANDAGAAGEALLHPKYKLPASCFAYVGDAARPHTWKLPYRLCGGAPDLKRLPKAIQCILTNYRGMRVSDVPEMAIPAVLARLAGAAREAGRLPPEAPHPAPAYRELAAALDQFPAPPRLY